MQKTRAGSSVVVFLLMASSAELAAQVQPAMKRWSVTYSAGVGLGGGGEKALKASIAAAGFHRATTYYSPGGCGIICLGPYTSHYNSLQSRNESQPRAVSVAYAASTAFSFRAQFSYGGAGSAEGERLDLRRLAFQHRYRSGGVQAVASAGPFRVGFGPELTFARVQADLFDPSVATPIKARTTHHALVGGVASGSLVLGSRFFAELGLQSHVGAKANVPEFNAPGVEPGNSTRFASTRLSFNRAELSLSAGFRW